MTSRTAAWSVTSAGAAVHCPPPSLDLLDRVLEVEYVGHDDRGAVASERKGNRLADAARGTRDDGDPTL